MSGVVPGTDDPRAVEQVRAAILDACDRTEERGHATQNSDYLTAARLWRVIALDLPIAEETEDDADFCDHGVSLYERCAGCGQLPRYEVRDAENPDYALVFVDGAQVARVPKSPLTFPASPALPEGRADGRERRHMVLPALYSWLHDTDEEWGGCADRAALVAAAEAAFAVLDEYQTRLAAPVVGEREEKP